MAVKEKTYTCTNCEKSFNYGDWEGCNRSETGEHQVKAKTFYSRYGRYALEWKMGRTSIDKQGNPHSTRGKSARFQGGKYVTTDPEEQAFLEKEVEKKGLLTKEQYEKRNTPKELQVARLEQKTKDQQKLMDEQKGRIAELEAAGKKKPGKPKAK